MKITLQLKKQQVFVFILGMITMLILLCITGNLTIDGYGVKYWKELQFESATTWSALHRCLFEQSDLQKNYGNFDLVLADKKCRCLEWGGSWCEK